ncbi:MAG: hypothetical protein Q8M24_14635 [Pseudolabrys sp.]|nr:hypothetical protein [Pseudolabrys sp.]MDP2296685.1 hypothetical protein [Pseudolabrys sp.]
MVIGRFETFSGRPTVDCYLDIKTIGVSGMVPFLIDTGADCTVLMPGDANSLGIDFDTLKHSQTVTSVGVGGECVDFLVPAILMVRENKVAKAYRFGLRIAMDERALDGAPSLLGRDILQYWRILCDFPNKKLEIDILMEDEEFALP